MPYFGIDLAALTPRERAASSFLLGGDQTMVLRSDSPTETFSRARTLADSAGMVIYRLDWVAVRAKDPRLDEVLKLWREYAYPASSMEEGTAIGDRILHGRHLKVVFDDWLAEFHIIPKSLGIPNLEDSDSDGVAYPVFDPQIYHGEGGALVFPWLGNDQPFLVAQRLETGKPLYFETAEHYLAYRLAVNTVRLSPDPLVPPAMVGIL